MCGIVGYVGDRPCGELLIAGLEKLEYRGYDSAGLSVIADGEVESVRAVGNLANLRAAVEERANGDGGRSPSRRRPPTIGHRPHPLGDPRPRHRGERPSARRLRRDPHRPQRDRREPRRAARASCEAEGHDFTSETDAEVVAHLIARHYDGDLAAAVRAAFAELRGHYAFVAMHADQPGHAGRRPQGVPADRRARRGRELPRLRDPRLPRRDAARAGDRERRDRHDRQPGGVTDHRRRRDAGRAREPRRSPGTRTPPRRAATRPSC